MVGKFVLTLFKQGIGHMAQRQVALRFQQKRVILAYQGPKLLWRICAKQRLYRIPEGVAVNRWRAVGGPCRRNLFAGFGGRRGGRRGGLVRLVCYGVWRSRLALLHTTQQAGHTGHILGKLYLSQVGVALVGRQPLNQQLEQGTGLVAPGMFGAIGGRGKEHAGNSRVVQEKRRTGLMLTPTMGA